MGSIGAAQSLAVAHQQGRQSQTCRAPRGPRAVGGRAIAVAPACSHGDRNTLSGLGTSYSQVVGANIAAQASPCARHGRSGTAASSGRHASSVVAATSASILPGDDTKFTLDDLVNLIVRA